QHTPEEKGAMDTATTAQSDNGFEIFGTLKDERGEPIVAAIVEISNQGTVTGRTLTDFDGNYSVTALEGGSYDVTFSYLGKERTITGVDTRKSKTRVCGQLAVFDGRSITGAVHIWNSRPIPEPPGRKTHRAGDNLP